MPRLADGLLVSVTSGIHAIPEIPVPDANNRIKIRLQRCTTTAPLIWPNKTTTVRIVIEVSYDNGGTWQGFLEATAEGGVHVTRGGGELTETTLSGTLEPGMNRKLRVFLDIAGGPLMTNATIEAL